MLSGIRNTVVFVAVVAFIAAVLFEDTLWPWGYPIPVLEHERPAFSDIDKENDSLQAKHGRLSKIYERIPKDGLALVKGPECVLFDHQGTMYVLTEEGKLVSLTQFQGEEPETSKTGNSIPRMSAQAAIIQDLGMGRPLGGTFDYDASTDQTILYAADALLGLIRVKNIHDPYAKVELLASRVQEEDGTWSPILYANDVAIGPKTGMIYFTDSSDIAPKRVGTRTWDTLAASLLDGWRGRKTGRLLRYDPATHTTTILARGFAYSNGLEVDANEEFLIMAETFAFRLWKIPLPNGSPEVLVDSLPGYPDNVGCHHEAAAEKSTTVCYVALPWCVIPTFRLVAKLPHPVDRWLRAFLMVFLMKPGLIKYGGVAQVEVGSPEHSKTSYSLLQDPKGKDISVLNSVAVRQNKLYFGSLVNKFITVYDMN